MSIARHHAEWLSLVEVSGPFLSMPVLLKVFPQGLDAHDPEHLRSLRLAHEEWEDRQADPAYHRAWVRFVLTRTLFKTSLEFAEAAAYRRVAKGLRNPRRLRDAQLRIAFLTCRSCSRIRSGWRTSGCGCRSRC